MRALLTALELAPAPKDTIILTQAALVGIITLHLAMPTVLSNYPDRVQPDVDGYIAVVDCREIGARYVLEIPGHAPALVAVADCAQPHDAQIIEYSFGGQWLADVDAHLWDDLPRWPQLAWLWPERAWQMQQRRMERIQ